MAALAVCLFRVNRSRRSPAQDVCASVDQLHVLDVHARPVAAEMINLEVNRKRASL
jgi:hypothetical protein